MQPKFKKSSDGVPSSLRDLMQYKWGWDQRYSAFDMSTQRGDRIADPSYYYFRRGDIADGVRAFSFNEALSLARDGFSHVDGGVVVINEHVAHAISDFLGEVSAAWEKAQRRINGLPKR